MSNYISLSVPSLKGNELEYVKECIDTEWVSSAGKYVNLFEKKISKYTGSKFAIACVNGTSALQLSLVLIGIEPEDEVIVPSLTFIAPVNAIAYQHAIPVFMDSDKYFNIDVEKTIEFIKKETTFKGGFTFNKTTGNKIIAIIPVHVWGNAVFLDELVEICQARNIRLIEDASESLGTKYIEGKYAQNHTGTVGELGCISFNGNKIITTGGGGMILTDDEMLARKAQYLSTQAKDDNISYIHNSIGYNFRLTNLQAALGVAQLEQLEQFLKRKVKMHNLYSKLLKRIEGLSLYEAPSYSSNNHWLNILKISKGYGASVSDILKKLQNQNIETRPVWHLNHLQKPYIKNQSYKIETSENLLKSSLCMPSSVSLKREHVEYIVDCL